MTLVAWLVAFLIVFAILAVAGRALDSLPDALNALVFTAVLVPIMGNVVMPLVSATLTRWLPDQSAPNAAGQARRRQLGDRGVTVGEGIEVTRAGDYPLRPIGWVESPLTDRAAPGQADDPAPPAWLVFPPAVAAGLTDLAPGSAILVLSWLDRSHQAPPPDLHRPSGPEHGVFGPDTTHRPNPLGVHRATIVSIDNTRIRVAALHAPDGTPIVDVRLFPDARVGETDF